MKTILAVLAVFLTVFLAAAMTGGQQPGDLQVVYNLSGNLNDLENKELVVTFSDDMLPLGGKRDGASLVKITPAIQGRFNWRGNRTLAFKPEPRFRFSSTYTAVVPAGTRSLAGKVLAKAIRWQWSTPQAYPVEIKTAGREYFSSLRQNEKLDFAVWVKDPLTLRFEQKVAAGEAGSFFSLREAKNNEPVAIQILQKAADELEIRYARNLKRGVLYQFIIKKGFCGSEGRTGTAKDFHFSFGTIADFAYSGSQELLLFPDSPYCWLTFSNALAEIDPAIIRIFRVQEGKKIALKFSVESRYYENSALLLRVEDELASGDELNIRVERSLANLHKETLREDLDLKGRVCSSRSPRIGFSMPGKNLSMTAKSIKKASVRTFKFRPDFYSQLERVGYGILQQKDFAARFIQKEVMQNLENLPEKTNTQDLPDHELGSALGFFGLLVERYEPFNVCMDARILRHPIQMPPLLQVFHRRNMDLVVKTGQGQTLYWLYDNRSGRKLGGKPLFLRGSGEAEALGATAANGVLLNDRALSQSNLVMARNPENNDMTLVRIDRQHPSDHEIRISVFSDRDFYKPGDTVHIGGIVKEYASGKVSSPKGKTALLEIRGPDGQQVKTDKLQLDAWGGFHYDFKSDPAGKKGRYRIQANVEDDQRWQGMRDITIDYYQPNTFEMTISDMAKHYLPEDMFRPVASGAYLAGNPMAGDGVSYHLALQPVTAQVFRTMDLDRHRFGLDRDLTQSDPPIAAEKKLDRAGQHALAIPMSSFPRTNHLADLHFSTTGKTAEGKEFTARARSLFFPGNLLTGIHIGYYQNLKDEVKADLALVDFQGKPFFGEVRVTLYKEHYENSRRQLKKVSGPDDVYIEKSKLYAFRVQEAGRYVLRCDTPDAKGRVVSTSSGFFAWASGYADQDSRLRIESDGTILRSGETLKCFIRSPREGQALVTIERGKVLDSRVIELQKMTLLDIPVKKEYFPGIRISVIAMFENNVSEEATKDFQVKDEGKTLLVALECPGEIKPASKAKVRIQVRDQQKNGARAKLYVYAVDEGNLSLQGYGTPDAHQRFYYVNPLGNRVVGTYYSKNYTHWTFERPMMDIDLRQPAIFGCIFRPDATPLAGAIVTLEDEKYNKLKTTTTSAQGYYSFPGLPGSRYAIKAEANGFHPFLRSDIYFNGHDHHPLDLVLLPKAADSYYDPGDGFGLEAGVANGAMPAPMVAEMKNMARQKGEGEAEDRHSGSVGGGIPAKVAGIHVRSDFREVLFFRTVETDETGKTEIEFASSDQLSTYRIMAVAYNEDSFGAAEKKIMVSKDLLISEAMPEFARQGDEFLAGVQLSNRATQKLPFTLLVKPAGVTVRGAAQIEGTLDARGNGLFQFPFLADRIGEARVEFFALSAADKDGLEKKLLVSDRLVRETLLDFASGKTVRKTIEPQADGEEQSISIKVAPSLLRPAINIAKKLVFYPYECLEQRTSKVMPFLALSPQLAERLELGLEPAQIREAVNGFLKIIPEFMNSDGALSYYRGGQYTSDYLTAYVLWALHLARERDYKVDPQLVQKLSAYLQRASLDKTTASFYQFVLSLGRKADNKKLKTMAAERDSLSLPARVFLYRALNNQQIGKELLSAMLNEFNNSQQVEADFAYFDAGEFQYQRDYPFYSSRYVTALLLQAVLEVEHGHVLAERIINWLLEGEPHCWNTTQTNFWILCAMDEYLKQVEKTTARGAEITLLGNMRAKAFANSQDTLQIQKKIEDKSKPIEVTVKADQPVYVTSELTWKLAKAGKKSRGIDIQRNVYNEKGEAVNDFQRGQVYMVELLLKSDKEVPYGVIDEPLAAGFELLRQDIATTRSLKEFNTKHNNVYRAPWARRENAADRLVFYTYSMQGPLRLVYFIKAMYSGRFTWMPVIAQGMYHPQYFGRTAIQTIEIKE